MVPMATVTPPHINAYADETPPPTDTVAGICTSTVLFWTVTRKPYGLYAGQLPLQAKLQLPLLTYVLNDTAVAYTPGLLTNTGINGSK